MKFDIKELKEDSISFIVKETSTSILNPIRRILVSELPKMAIEDVEFHLGPIRDETGKEFESVSPLFDEIIGHRLGLLPVPTDLKLFGFRDACVCKGEGCPNCTIMYTLNKKGPCTVYSRDLEPLGDAKFAIKDLDIPIVKLDEGQAILIYATAILGKGQEHAKWQVVSGPILRYYPEIKIDSDICDNGGACIDECPRSILTRDGEKVVVGDNYEDCILCDACVEICTPRGGEGGKGKKAISVGHDTSRLICGFETDGSISAIDALRESIAIMKNKLISFSENLENTMKGPLWEVLVAEEEAREEAALEAEEAAALVAEEEGAVEGEEPAPEAPPPVVEPAEDFSKIPDGDIGIFTNDVAEAPTEGPEAESREPEGEPGAEEPAKEPEAEEEEPAEEPGAEEPEAEPSIFPLDEPAEEPKAEEPAEEPEAEEPAEEPEAEEPAEEPKAEEPAEEPKAEEPAEEPKAEEPEAEEPAEEPEAEEPAEEPEAEEPEAEEPAEEPEAEEPEAEEEEGKKDEGSGEED